MEDEIKGIAGDRKFMDYYYRFLELKKDCLASGENVLGAKRKSCFENYFAALNQCFLQIDKLCNGDIRRNYLNWIRWNNVNIIVQLAFFKEDTVLNEEIEKINETGKKIKTLLEVNFQMSEIEKGVSNEYVHAFDQIQRKEASFEKPNLKIVQQAGRLLINYINYLTHRCYVSTMDREDYDQERLKNEAEYLSTALRRFNDIDLAEGVETSIKNYLEFCELDSAAIKGQERMMEEATKLAHKRATETFLETAIRIIEERIKEIKEGTLKKMRELVTASKVLKQAIRHPFDTMKNLVNVVKRPIKSVKGLIKFAKKHPWQLGAIVLGGITIGVCSGGAVFGAMAAIHFSSLPVTLPIAALGGVAFGASAITSTAIISLANVGDTVAKIDDEEKRQVSALKAKEALVKADITKKGASIANDIKYDQYRCGTEENIAKFKEFMEELEEHHQEQLDSMSLDELNTSQKELSDGLFEIVDALECAHGETKECHKSVIEIQEKTKKIDEGKAAAIWFMQDAKEKNHVPLAESEDDDSESE